MTAKPELKVTTSGINVTEFNIAINRKVASGKPQETDFIKCQAWRGTCDFITKYFDKGSSICVVGSIQTRSWEKDGQKHYATEVIVDEAMFVDSRNEVPNTVLPAKINMDEIPTDEGLPF